MNNDSSISKYTKTSSDLGTKVEKLPTPSLLLDIEIVRSNYASIAKKYKNTACKMSQHGKNLKTHKLALMQIEAGGTVNGICSAKVSEAEVMVSGGIKDILITNQIVTPDKIKRMCKLSKLADIKVCVDNLENVRLISEIASTLDTTIGILIEIETNMKRAGVRTIEYAINIVKLIDTLPNIQFRGIMSHQALYEYQGEKHRKDTAKNTISKCLEFKKAIESEGFPIEIVSSGETFTYDVSPKMPGVTEVEGGTYALMGTVYSFLKDFEVANKLLTTIINKPDPQTIVCDIGYLSMPRAGDELLQIENLPNVKFQDMYKYHTVFTSSSEIPINIGAKVKLIPNYQDPLIDSWDEFFIIENDILIEILPITGRGTFH